MIRRLALILLAAVALAAPASAQEARFPHDVFQGGGMRMLGQTDGQTIIRQPLIDWMVNGERAWQMGLDSHTAPLEDLVLAVRGRDNIGPGVVEDVIYLRDWDGIVATGFSITPPLPGYRVQIGTPDGTSWGTLMLRLGAGSTGDAVHVRNSAGHRLFAVDHLGRVLPREGAALPVMGGVRVRSEDLESPAALHLNANPGDIGSDFSLQNAFVGGVYQLQVRHRGETVLAVASGDLIVPSGRLRLGDGLLYEESGELRWRLGDAETVLAPRADVAFERITTLESALARSDERLAVLEDSVEERLERLEAEVARQRAEIASTRAALERRERALARCVAARVTKRRVACA